MSPASVYRIYHPLKVHFTTDTHIGKYRGCMPPITQKAWDAKSPGFKAHLGNLGRRIKNPKAIGWYFIANFITGDKYGGVTEPDGYDKYIAWRKRFESMGYIFRKDMNHMIQEFGSDIPKWWEGLGHISLYKEFWGGRISLESITILNKIYNFTQDGVIKSGDVITSRTSSLIEKYQYFMAVDIPTYQNKIVQIKNNE